jgi:hypothetical protein
MLGVRVFGSDYENCILGFDACSLVDGSRRFGRSTFYLRVGKFYHTTRRHFSEDLYDHRRYILKLESKYYISYEVFVHRFAEAPH